MKCQKHNCELVQTIKRFGWGAPVKLDCPECKKENEELMAKIRLDQLKSGSSEEGRPRRGGWQ